MIIDSIIPNSDRECWMKSFIKKLGKKKIPICKIRMRNDFIEYLNIVVA